ncbi:MAG TPA: IS200/IS605 family transposase [Ktedonobacterales bacterium]|nr:IS200/IS605 family transposase [Ktedonobacterales bacterium]
MITYHFVWGPMRFKPCLTGEVAERLRALIFESQERASAAEYAPLTIVVRPDRVYLSAAAPPTTAPHRIVCQVKARTSRALREEFPELTRIPTLWTRAYLVMAGDQLTAEEVLRRFEAALPPRRRPGRPRKVQPTSTGEGTER